MSGGQSGIRRCKRCLLRETDEGAYFKHMYAYIENLPEEDKVPDPVYEQRLAVCRECDNLLNGMCRICGCYVEMRAAMKIRGCPGSPERWSAYDDGKKDETPLLPPHSD